jgi:PAS domain S-box-containing protein
MKMIEKLTHEVIEALLDALPMDITFVDEDDRVRYFNKEDEQIFARSRKIIGIKVQECHSQKSIHVVNQILQDFRNNKRDSANFWTDLKGRKIHIRYFAVRDKEGKYLGCLEATQDITDIQKITGEKRILD